MKNKGEINNKALTLDFLLIGNLVWFLFVIFTESGWGAFLAFLPMIGMGIIILIQIIYYVFFKKDKRYIYLGFFFLFTLFLGFLFLGLGIGNNLEETIAGPMLFLNFLIFIGISVKNIFNSFK